MSPERRHAALAMAGLAFEDAQKAAERGDIAAARAYAVEAEDYLKEAEK